MITIESRARGIKFECHKEESLISLQFMKNQKKSKASHFLIFYSINSSKTFTDLGAYLRAPYYGVGSFLPCTAPVLSLSFSSDVL